MVYKKETLTKSKKIALKDIRVVNNNKFYIIVLL